MPEATISAAGLRIVKLLVGNPPQTIADLVKEIRVTRTAITEQLRDLVAAGFVDRSTEHVPGRGRPRHLYSATQAAMLILFASNQTLVAPAVWRAIRDEGGDALTAAILKRVSLTLADHYNRKITATEPEERLREMTQLLAEEGGLVDAVVEDGQLVLHKRTCPFVAMADESGSICCVDEEMMNAIVGRPVRRTACRHEGAPCCTFEIVRDP